MAIVNAICVNAPSLQRNLRFYSKWRFHSGTRGKPPSRRGVFLEGPLGLYIDMVFDMFFEMFSDASWADLGPHVGVMLQGFWTFFLS